MCGDRKAPRNVSNSHCLILDHGRIFLFLVIIRQARGTEIQIVLILASSLVEKSSKPAAPINYHWRFQLSRASKKNKVDPT
jgi:hypothetical protein